MAKEFMKTKWLTHKTIFCCSQFKMEQRFAPMRDITLDSSATVVWQRGEKGFKATSFDQNSLI